MHEDRPSADLVADEIQKLYTFKTFSDTKEILYYHKGSGLYLQNAQQLIEAETQKWMREAGDGEYLTRGFVGEVVGHIQRSTYVNRDSFNSEPGLLLVKNGILDINKRLLMQPSSGYLFTMGLPVNYDPSAKCPAIDKFISEIVRAENVQLLFEIIGWCLDINSGFQNIVLLTGEGANGKSTFTNLIRAFLGEKNCSAIPMQALVTDKFSVARLYGKMANLYPDLQSIGISDAGPLKALSGSDTIDAQEKFKPFFAFRNTAKMIFSANQPPRIGEDTMAIWRRIIVVDFPNQFIGGKDNKNLMTELNHQKELSGLLNRALAALKAMKEAGKFSYASTIAETRERYLLLADPIPIFFEDKCEYDPNGSLTKEELYQAYAKWCKEKSAIPINKIAFGRQMMRARYARPSRTNWLGISFKIRDNVEAGGGAIALLPAKAEGSGTDNVTEAVTGSIMGDAASDMNTGNDTNAEVNIGVTNDVSADTQAP